MIALSVVIPSLNDAVMLRQCLTALAAQTRPPDEIIVVDNGSTDDTSAVARAAGARVVFEPQRGVLRATAAGFDAARGDVIGRLDADSIPAAEWAARLEQRFAADETLAALTGSGTFYGCGRGWQWVGRHIYLGGYFWFMGMLTGHVPLFGSNFALRRDAWRAVRDRVHLDDPRSHDDLDISFVLDPEMAVEFDEDLRVQVSGRPFSDFAGFRRRASWAFHNVAVNWAEIGWATRTWRCAQARRGRYASAEVSDGTAPASPR